MSSTSDLLNKLLNDHRPALQRLLVRYALWDEVGQQLIVELTPFHPKLGLVAIPSWEQMLTLSEKPMLPNWPLLHWPEQPAVVAWRKAIPTWVVDTLRRLPQRHQLLLLWLCARYPQMLEMLDKTPVMAWRIAAKGVPENELKRYFPEPRAKLAARLGWPERRETIRFLNRLRLRKMDEPMLQQVDACLSQPEVLSRACHLPRINSMALTLSAHFPQLIDTPLHHSLARQPCQPQQCQALHACLADALKLATWLDKPLDPIAQCRFMVEIEDLYQKWLEEALQRPSKPLFAPRKKNAWQKIGGTPVDWRPIDTEAALYQACQDTGHAWFIEWGEGYALFHHSEHNLVCALHPHHAPIARTGRNQLPTHEQQAQVSLLAAAITFEPDPTAS